MADVPTVLSFPTYAELTQTSGWAQTMPATVRVPRHASISGDRYTEGAVLGVGGMGKVVLARDARVGRDVAVKVMHGERELELEERARFLREAQVQGQLEHPSIVPVYDIGQREDGSTFFTMRRVLGHTLHAIIEEMRTGRSRYTQRELLAAFATVCLTIDYAHTRNVIHRDLKPANIMLGDFGEVYVLDWGLARLVDPMATPNPDREPELLGTPLYMPPEQMADSDVGPSADVFALGTILFEILTLLPAKDPNALISPVEARPSVRAPDRGIAPELETICVRATAFDPADRYPTPRALQEAVARYLEGDRELEQRRSLASQHVDAARQALTRSRAPNASYEEERGAAITELGRAVALDPTNGETLAMLGELISAPPPERMPREVERQMADEDQRVIRLSAKLTLFAIGSWWLFMPIVFAIGLHTGWLVWPIAVPIALGCLFSVLMMRAKVIGPTLQYAALATQTLAIVGVSRFYGPHVLVPGLATAYAIVVQAHPKRTIRFAAVCTAVCAFLVPAILEWAGLVARSYSFAHGTWTISPRLVELPAVGTNMFISCATVLGLIVSCSFISRLREELTAAQASLAVQAWHWRQLSDRLIGRRSEPAASARLTSS